MCGIAGFIGRGTRQDINAMTDRQAHRGPDEEDYWETNLRGMSVCLGFRRLIVIDPRGGHQPMSTEDRHLTVVFNGEIYNHRELRRELESLGHDFRSDHSDTEVLLHGYRQWGRDLPRHLKGMFAFALVDTVKSCVFLARDRLGKKPLFLARFEWGFAFASELTALLAHSAIPATVDRESVVRYLALGYVPPPKTLFAGVQKLGAGECAIYDLGSRRLDIATYWAPTIGQTHRASDMAQSAAQLLKLLNQAVARRLESDVPLGFFLSGGIDSAAIAAMATKQIGAENIHTFTIGFSEQSYDESSGARETANALGASHHERRFSLEDAEELVNTVLPKIDEPIADPSLLPTYLLSKFASEHVTVALSGDGGDELFAGYDTFAARSVSRFYRRLVPNSLHAAIRYGADLLPRGTTNLSFDFLLRRWLRGVGEHPAFWDAIWLAPASLHDIAELTGAPAHPETIYHDVSARWETSGASHLGDRQLDFYTRYYLQCDILTKVDRASMLNGLEVRAPFLDEDVFAFSEELPYVAKHRRLERKRVLRQAVGAIVPTGVLARPKKGFGMPVAAWLRKLPMPDPFRMSDVGLDPDILRQRWHDHASGKADHRGLLWAWLCLDASLGKTQQIRTTS